MHKRRAVYLEKVRFKDKVYAFLFAAGCSILGLYLLFVAGSYVFIQALTSLRASTDP